MSEWVSEWVSERESKWVSESVSEWLSEWVSQWVSEWVSQWVSQWVSDWDSEWVSECVSKCVCAMAPFLAGGAIIVIRLHCCPLYERLHFWLSYKLRSTLHFISKGCNHQKECVPTRMTTEINPRRAQSPYCPPLVRMSFSSIKLFPNRPSECHVKFIMQNDFR